MTRDLLLDAVLAIPSTPVATNFHLTAATSEQPAAIKLVMDQMEAMAPRYADERR